MNKQLKEILTEMFLRVNQKFSEDLVKEPDWYLEFTWTEQEQEDFKKWLIEYLKNNKESRYELMSIPNKSQRFLESFANEFLLNYGWKFK
jgi:hypothetical protein